MNNGELKQIRKWIEEVDKKLNNHLISFGKDVTGIKISITGIKTDVSWLKKFFWIVMTVSIGAIITALLTLIIR